jgi:DNA repair exonuclease SbcCD ATPase subunit
VTTVFLQRLEISNFRAYGDNFSLSLPGPGVTILTGPHGLGRSALFEAIEWALTGRVRRLEALTQESLDRGRHNGLLARREGDVPVAQYRVSLEFVNVEGESSRIERRAVREQENIERFTEALSPTQQQVIDLLRADSWLNEISDIGEYLRLDSALAEARVRHAASHAALVGLQGRLRAALDVDERRRGAETKRDTLLRLSAARKTIAQGAARRSSLASEIDRHTHELWMVQTYLRDTIKAIQQHEAVQAARDQLPDLESLNDHRANLMARIDELSLVIKREHEVVAQVEQELLAAHALQQQYPELLSTLGALPSDEADAIDEAVRAVEQLVQHERQLVQSEEPFPSALVKLNEEISQAQAALAQEASEAQSIEWSRWPALLLDEPLQLQDPIHTAAFIEGLRTLVRERNYQVILSTHDEELADDICRKMMVAGVQCVICRYRGLGSTGVLYSMPV